MKTSSLVLAATLAGALSVPALLSASAQTGGPAPVPNYDFEKCYGIAKAGSNDCQTSNSSCAGTSKRDGQWDAWVYLPAGTCSKLANGNLEPTL